MNGDQVAALFMMLAVGLFSAFARIEVTNTKVRAAIIVWVALWTAPPLLILWSKGVMG